MESQKEQQQLVYARSTEDQEEIARLNVKLAEMHEGEFHSSYRFNYSESISVKQAWQMLKSENALLIANNTVKNKYISQLDAKSRRTWFEGEIQLFSVRAGLQKVDGAFNLDQTSTPFLGLGDIPWPCSPNVSLDQDVSIDMIRSFLLQDFNSEDAVFFCTKIMLVFDKSTLKKWIKFVVECDRERVVKRSVEVVKCLNDIIDEIS